MDRKLQYKHKQDNPDAIRDRLRCEQNELRKEKRDAAFSGKRVRLGEDDSTEYTVTPADVHAACEKLLKKTDDRAAQLKLLRQAFAQGTALIDVFLSIDNSVACLVGLLTGLDPELQLNAAWCLTNMAAGTDDQAMVVIKHAGAYLVTYLASGNVPLQDQCAWAIGNLAGGSADCREILLAQGALPALTKLLQAPVSCVVQSAAFALSNLARDRNIHQSMVENGVIDSLAKHLQFSTEKLNVISEAAWVMTYLAASGVYTSEIFTAGIPNLLTAIVTQLHSEDADNFLVLTPVLRCIGNIVCGISDDQAAFVSQDQQIFPCFAKLLSSEHPHLRKETLWVVSNITVFTSACFNIVEAGLTPRIVTLLSDMFDIRKEALLCLCNIATQGAEFCRKLFESGAVAGTVPLLRLTDSEVVHMALCLVEMILQHVPEGVQQFEESGGVDALELLEYSSNDVLRSLTNKILDSYFYKDDD